MNRTNVSSLGLRAPVPRRCASRFIAACCLSLSWGAAWAGAAGPYEIQKTEPKIVQGGHGTASLTIDAKAGWHVNPNAPITLSLAAGAGLSTAKAKLGRSDLAKSTNEVAVFDIPLEATTPGAKTMSAEAKFVPLSSFGM